MNTILSFERRHVVVTIVADRKRHARTRRRLGHVLENVHDGAVERERMQQPLRAVHYPPRRLHLRAKRQAPEVDSVVLPATRAHDGVANLRLIEHVLLARAAAVTHLAVARGTRVVLPSLRKVA